MDDGKTKRMKEKGIHFRKNKSEFETFYYDEHRGH